MLCGPRESYWQSTKESVGMGIGEEGNTRSIGQIRSEMSLYEGEKMGVRVDSQLSEEFDVKVGMNQLSVLSTFSAVVVDVVTEFTREGALSELLYADDFILMSERVR